MNNPAASSGVIHYIERLATDLHQYLTPDGECLSEGEVDVGKLWPIQAVSVLVAVGSRSGHSGKPKTSRIAGGGGFMFTAAFFGDLFDVATRAQRLKWVFGQAASLPPGAQDGTDIRPEGGAEALFGFYQAALLL